MSNEEVGSIVDFIKGTVAPRVFKTGPPGYYTQTSFTKKLDVSANFVVDDSAIGTATTEKIPTSSGMILWMPNRGAGSMWHMGFVSAGVTVPGNGIRGWYSSTADFQGAVPPGSLFPDTVLRYDSPLAIPYNGTITSDLIKISPDLELSFSQVRVYSGDLRVICDTVPIGNLALNGYFSAGCFSDTRDVCQVADGAGNPSNCFAPGDLVQLSITTKEGLKEVPAMKGVVSLVGSDIQPFYSPPNADYTDSVNAGWVTYNGLAGGYSPILNALVSNSQYCISRNWISPWNTSIQNTGTTVCIPAYNNINATPINIAGVLDFKVHLICSVNNSANSNGCNQKYRVRFAHYFVSCTSNTGNTATAYGVNYVRKWEEYDYHVLDGDWCTQGTSTFVPPTFGGARRISVESNPRMYQQGLTSAGVSGMYLGTQIEVWAMNHSQVSSNHVSFGKIGAYEIQVRARNLYGLGEIGPARVIRWDAMSNGQQIKVDGCINAQCIPEGAIAPFVQTAAMYSDTATNLNAITTLAELYNGESPFRRNWTGESYDEFMRTVFPNFSLKSLVDGQPKLKNMAMAAVPWGLLANVGRFAAHNIGQGALQTLGSIGMANAMSSGQFGRSAGEFGRSAGEFEAGGKYRRGRSKSGRRAKTPKRKASATPAPRRRRGRGKKRGTTGSRAGSVVSHRSTSSRRSKSSHRSKSSRRSGSRRSNRSGSRRSGSVASHRSGSSHKSSRSKASMHRRMAALRALRGTNSVVSRRSRLRR